MPLAVGPDPNNPGGWIWIDSQTGLPAIQPGGPNTPWIAPSDQAPAAAPDVGGPVQGPPSTMPDVTPPDTTGLQNSVAIVQAFDPAIRNAQGQYDKAWQAMQAADNALAAATTQKGTDPLASTADAQRNVDNARTVLQRAADSLTRVQESKASALERFSASRWATPEEKARASALAEDAHAQAQLRTSQVEVATATQPDQIKKAQADAADAQANVQLTQAKVQVATATTQDQITQAHTAVAQAQANVDSTKIANQRLRAETTTAQAQAAVSPQLAQSSVDQAQANVNKTLTDIAELQQKLRQAPTDEQAQQAIQTQLIQKQTELQTAQQQLEQTKRLMPLAVEQAGLNVQATRQGIEQKAQGPLYGVVDQIAKYKELIASGQMSPEAADSAISDYVNQQVTGSTALQRQTAQNQYQQSQYATQTDFNRSMAQTGAGFMNQGLGTLTNALGTMTPGHGAEYAGAVQALAGLWNQIGQKYAAPAPPPSAVQTAPVVHINIGGQPADQGAAPTMPGPLNAGAPAQPVAVGGGAGPLLPDHMRPATPQDVMSLWGSGGIDRTSQGLGGM